MPTIIDSLLVKLGLDSSEFSKGKNNVEKGLKDTGNEADKTGKKLQKTGKDGKEGFDSVAKSAVKFLALIGGTMAIKNFASDMIESNAALDRFSLNVNENANSVSAWMKATELAGGSASGLQGTMDMLSQSQTELMLTGQSSLIPYFSALGMSLADAHGKARPVNDLLLELSDRFSRMDRTTANNMGRMMGIDQGTLQLLLKGRSEVELMIARQKEYGAVTKKQAEEASRLREAMVGSRQSFEAFGRELLSDATPALEKLFEMFSDFGAWIRENKNFVENFLLILGVGLAGIGAALIPINLTVTAVVALAGAIALLTDDYQTWKEGGDSLIDWSKWEPGITKAKEALTWLKSAIGDISYRFIALADVAIGVATGDWERIKFASAEYMKGSGENPFSFGGGAEPTTAGALKLPATTGNELMSGHTPFSGIPGATQAAAGSGAVSQATMTANHQTSSNNVETHIGEVKVYTAATDANGVAKDMGDSLDYLFTSQMNYGLF